MASGPQGLSCGSESDEAIVSVFAHEMHEINALREMLENGRTIPYKEWYESIMPKRPGNLHDQAWDIANDLLDKIFGN